ncbi:30S ribosomal protein S13 [Patescibacteria group bacterium]|nr:30S ribosomal protein S13 [Patescibacteria group bacterium]MBU1966735.1 30S ribosomal protein S13 [Patescibacteria group bacterium]MBU2543737.1 30S ribosomal protein S13 [Patescibacteria group bacterium]
MPRITGFDIPDEKKIAFSLRYIYGVGPKVSIDILANAKVDPEKRAKDLTADEINRIAKQLERHTVAGQLRRVVRDNIERLKRVGSYRGLRHRQGLPVRGQRTRSNARTGRGKRKTVGALSKEVAAKLEE